MRKSLRQDLLPGPEKGKSENETARKQYNATNTKANRTEQQRLLWVFCSISSRRHRPEVTHGSRCPASYVFFSVYDRDLDDLSARLGQRERVWAIPHRRSVVSSHQHPPQNPFLFGHLSLFTASDAATTEKEGGVRHLSLSLSLSLSTASV